MKRFLGFALAMFFALVAIGLVGGDSGAVAGPGCHGAKRCHGGLLAKRREKKCHGERAGRKNRRCHGAAAAECGSCGDADGCGACEGGCAGGACGGAGVISEGVPTEAAPAAPAAPSKT